MRKVLRTAIDAPPVGSTGSGGRIIVSGRSGRRAGERRAPALVRRAAPSARRSRTGDRSDRTSRGPQAGRLSLPRKPRRGLPGRRDHERAVESCRTALAALAGLSRGPAATSARRCTALKRHAEAVEPLRRAVELRPTFVVAHQQPGDRPPRAGPDGRGARSSFRRAVELEPTYAPARTNLGQMLLDRGQAEEALTHCQEAVRAGPDIGRDARQPGQRPAGARPARRGLDGPLEALRLDPDLALANAHIGLILHKRGPASPKPCPG